MNLTYFKVTRQKLFAIPFAIATLTGATNDAAKTEYLIEEQDHEFARYELENLRIYYIGPLDQMHHEKGASLWGEASGSLSTSAFHAIVVPEDSTNLIDTFKNIY